MNWSKAKNIIIIFLIFLNIILMLGLTYNTDKNKLSVKEENAITKLLNQNNIQIQTEIPKDYSPMPTISLVYKQQDITELKTIFFGNSEDVKYSVEFDSNILKKDNITLTIKNNMIEYINLDNAGNLDEFSEDDAKKVVEQLIKTNLKPQFRNYKFGSLSTNNNKYYLVYYNFYNKYKFFDNYIVFCIANQGIESIKIKQYDIAGSLGINKEICSVDEALLTFMYEILKTHKDSIIINKIELGYIVQEEAKKGIDGRIIPCYKISIQGDKSIYINAYTNTLVKHSPFNFS